MNVFAAAARACRDGQSAALATVIGTTGSTPRQAGARMLVYGDGKCLGTIGGGGVERRVIEIALQAIANNQSVRYSASLDDKLGMSCAGDMEVYIEPLQSQPPLLLFGAGHVAHATAPLLCKLEFNVTVIDDRPELLTQERFPGCQIVLTDPLAFAQQQTPNPAHHLLFMTHLHSRDAALMLCFAQRPHQWMGMLASQRKASGVFHKLRQAGVDESVIAKINTPIGLNIQAETPMEIAVSIAAQLIASRRGASTSQTLPPRIPIT